MGITNNSVPRKDVVTALGSLEDVVAVMVKCANWHLHVDTASTLCSAKDPKCSINLAGFCPSQQSLQEAACGQSVW